MRKPVHNLYITITGDEWKAGIMTLICDMAFQSCKFSNTKHHGHPPIFEFFFPFEKNRVKPTK